MIFKREDFKKQYNRMREKHNLVLIDDHSIEYLENEKQKVNKEMRTTTYLITAFSASAVIAFGIAFYPQIRAFSEKLQVSLLALLENIKLTEDIRHSFGLPVLGFLVVMLTYLVWLPLYARMLIKTRFILRKSPVAIKIMNDGGTAERTLEITNIRFGALYIMMLISTLFFSAIVLVIALFNSDLIGPERLSWLLNIWTSVPLFLLGISAFLFSGSLLLWLFTGRYEQRLRISRYAIIEDLFSAVAIVDDLSSFELGTLKTKLMLLKLFDQIESSMRTLFTKVPQNRPASQWSSGQMELAADNFRRLAKEVYFPRPESIRELKRKLTIYTNIFLTGNYDKLPRKSIDPIESLKIPPGKFWKIKRILTLIFLISFMILPIACVLGLAQVLDFNIPAYLNPLLIVFYSLWGISVLAIFANNASFDIKEFLLEVFQRLLPH